MTPPGSEIAVPVTVVSVGIAALLGHDATFWIIVLSVSFLKLFSSGPVVDHKGDELDGWRYWRQQMINFWAAVIPPYVATKGIADIFEIVDRPAYYLIAIVLTIVGHGLLLYLMKLAANPSMIIDWIKLWRGGGK
jgi:hypothetical protein